MTTYVCTISPHSSLPPRERFLTEADTEDAALCTALLRGLELEGLEVNHEVLRSTLAQAKKNKEAPLRTDEEDGGCGFVLWYRPEDDNIGYGRSTDGTEAGLLSTRDNRWIKLATWRPDQARRKQLEGWSKEVLIDHVLRIEALQGG